jgi:citrate lyase subunit beta/citryl-CoA lyase
LFCPADRPERYAKAADAADIVILDLEDGVAAADKAAARAALLSTPLDPARTVVRINAVASQQALDLEALDGTDYTTLMLPKSEHPSQLLSLVPRQVLALIETPPGVLAAPEIARTSNVVGLMWGAEDLLAALGGGSSRHTDGSYRDVARHARSAVLLAGAAAGRYVIDAVHLDIADVEGLRAEAADAAAVGFAATACIHPTQAAVVRAAYRPDHAEVRWARDVLAKAAHERGVFTFAGRMVDAPVLAHADSILRRAESG